MPMYRISPTLKVTTGLGCYFVILTVPELTVGNNLDRILYPCVSEDVKPIKNAPPETVRDDWSGMLF